MSADSDRTETAWVAEVFSNENDTYWVPADKRSADDAVRIAARVAGPFHDSIAVHITTGTVRMRDGEPWFEEDADGEFECWRVDAQ